MFYLIVFLTVLVIELIVVDLLVLNYSIKRWLRAVDEKSYSEEFYRKLP